MFFEQRDISFGRLCNSLRAVVENINVPGIA
jgi:hypothetical protein